MEIRADYHTHTKFSHGRGSVEDNVIAAINAGMSKIAITDHGLKHIMFGLREDKLDKLREQVDCMNAKYKDKICVLMGVEANITGIDGTIDVPEELLHKFDIIIAGYHRMASLKDKKTFMQFTVKSSITIKKSKVSEIERVNALAFAKAMERYPIACIAHPNDMISLDMDILGEAAKETGTALEINLRHNALSETHIKKLKDLGASFMINSDAHSPQQVGALEKTISFAKTCGLEADDILNAMGCSKKVRLVKDTI